MKNQPKNSKSELVEILNDATNWLNTIHELEPEGLADTDQDTIILNHTSPPKSPTKSTTHQNIKLVDSPKLSPKMNRHAYSSPNRKTFDPNSEDEEDDEKLELEYRKLSAYTKNNTSKTKKYHQEIPKNFYDTSNQIDSILEASTKKAPDMAAYITYQKNKQNATPSSIASIDPKNKAADHAALAKYKKISNSVGKTASYQKGEHVNSEQLINSINNSLHSHSYQGQKPNSISQSSSISTHRHNSNSLSESNNSNSGAFLQTTTRQLSRPVNETSQNLDDSEQIKCKKARVKFDFKANSDKELSLKRNEYVWVYGDIDKNWYYGENISGIHQQKGIFPKNFVEIIDGSETVKAHFRVLEYGHADVLYDITGRNEKELSALKDDRLVLIKKIDENWWSARTTENGYVKQKKGIIPDSYIRVTKAPVTSEGVPDISCENDKLLNMKVDVIGGNRFETRFCRLGRVKNLAELDL